MITWMPHIRSLAVARSLSDKDLYEAVEEAKRVLYFIEEPSTPRNEIDWLAASMWEGYEYALCIHGLMLASELVSARHIAVDEVPGAYLAKIGIELERVGAADRTMPPWVGDKDVHRSHRSQLIMHTPAYETTWPGTPPQMPTLWPQPSDNDPRGYRLRLSQPELRRLDYGYRTLPEWLRYDESAREVLPA